MVIEVLDTLRLPDPPGARRTAFTIHDLVEEFGVTARTLRFYEEKGLIAPQRRGLERLYTRRDRARLKLVLMGKSVGFALEEVRDMLDLYDLGDGQATQLAVALERFEEKLAELLRRRDDIDRAYAALATARDAVRERLEGRHAAPPRPGAQADSDTSDSDNARP